MKELYTKNGRKYRQLQPKERGLIGEYYTMNMPISAIARRLSCSKSTIFCEIRRGKYRKNLEHIF